MPEFEILGPLRVLAGDGEIRIAGARRRALLARLLVAANELVPASRMADDLWAGEPSAAAASTLQSHISLLRKALGPGRLIGRDGGYVLEVADDELDAKRFENEARQGREALMTGDPATASMLLGTALGRWRGEALADVSGSAWALPERARLEELHLGATESWLEARLGLGEHQEVVALAEAAVADHPLREEIWGFLILALYRSGRQSDALRAYQRLRSHLGDELGIEPSAQLVALDDAIVQQKPELDWSGSEAGRSGPSRWNRASAIPPAAEEAIPTLPSGTVTLLFTDIEGSTRLWEASPDNMGIALARHDELSRACVTEAGGHVFKTIGDAICAVFAVPQQALLAAISAQRAFRAEPWPGTTAIHVRMGIHSGVCQERDRDYFGPTVNRAARLAATAHGDQVVVSGATAELLSDSLPAGVTLVDLGEHELKNLARPEHVFQVAAAGLERDFPDLRSQTSSERRHNLPGQISSFVGRVSELSIIRHQLSSSRLVTLAGPGGAGKTRLALHVAADLVDDLRDGAWFVELAPVADPAMVVRTAARVLLVREEPDRPLGETLATALRDRELLMVVDNCEQVLGSTSTLVSSILAECPGVSILATSREPLGISGEVLIRIPSMTVPPEDVTDIVAIDSYESARLFVERATSHHPGFQLTRSNAAAVASICRCLDGIPLAIELAAVRVRSLTPDEINSRLGDRFSLLTGGSRTAAPRHQTLRAAIDWSYDQLSAKEQAVLARLSVFARGWTMDEAEEVATGEGIEGWEVLDLLASLVDKSLIHCDGSSSISRYGMLESVRHYAAEALTIRGVHEVESARNAHGHAFLSLAETAALHFREARQSEWLDRLEMDHENLQTALGRFVSDPSAVDISLRMGIALHMFWLGRGYYVEGTEPLTAVLERESTYEIPALRSAALYALGNLLMRQGSNDDAKHRFDEALSIARRRDDCALGAEVLAALAWIGYIRGDDAAALADEAVTLARRSGEPRLIAVALERRADIVATKDLDGARADYAEALTQFHGAGNLSSAGELLSNLAVLELEAGDFDAARSHLDSALGFLSESNHVDALPAALCNLGLITFLQGGAQQAQSPFIESLITAKNNGMKTLVGYALLGLALCATSLGDDYRGATLHGAADALFDRCGESVQPLEDSLREKDHRRLRQTMTANGFATTYKAGRLLAVDDAVRFALDVRSDPNP